jgi:hypothetical protein
VCDDDRSLNFISMLSAGAAPTLSTSFAGGEQRRFRQHRRMLCVVIHGSQRRFAG